MSVDWLKDYSRRQEILDEVNIVQPLRRLLDCYPRDDKNDITLTRSLAITLHRALWDWIATNNCDDKLGWPGWEVLWDYTLHIDSHCFACDYAIKERKRKRLSMKTPVCDLCPLEWNFRPCNEDGALWDEWCDWEHGSHNTQSSAYQIRDLNERR